MDTLYLKCIHTCFWIGNGFNCQELLDALLASLDPVDGELSVQGLIAITKKELFGRLYIAAPGRMKFSFKETLDVV